VGVGSFEDVDERLDEEKLATLRRWGEGLTRDQRDEVRAAGRAILLLSEEVERLHVDLWHARAAGASNVQQPEEEEADVRNALRDRLFGLRPQQD
jgi:hypothetical protein